LVPEILIIIIIARYTSNNHDS